MAQVGGSADEDPAAQGVGGRVGHELSAFDVEAAVREPHPAAAHVNLAAGDPSVQPATGHSKGHSNERQIAWNTASGEPTANAAGSM